MLTPFILIQNENLGGGFCILYYDTKSLLSFLILMGTYLNLFNLLGTM